MRTTISPYLPSILSSARNAYASAPGAANPAKPVNDDTDASSQESSSTTVTLSDAAKAYLATAETADAAPPLATVAAEARAWFDAQYKQLGIESAMLDGEMAVDLTGQNRATLSAIASNAESLFSDDERAVARIALKSRFEGSLAPHVVIARHTRDYAALYQAAADYLDQAGLDERATEAWKNEHKAVAKGLAAAKAAPAKAPDTGDKNDPVHALLAKTTASGSPVPDTSTDGVTANARAMLDDQKNHARDKGTELVFDPARRSGQPVDFSNFDNRTLAVIVLNPDSAFSRPEIHAAKSELDLRTRSTMLNALIAGNGTANSSLGLLQTYAKMSDEEKSVLGVTEDVTNHVIRNYQTMMSIQNAFGAAGTPVSLSTYL